MANYLIIGGTGAIGSSVVKTLLSKGHNVFITGRDPDKTQKVAQKLAVPFAVLEASDFIAVDSIFEIAKNKIGLLNGVANCAGSLLIKPAHLTEQIEYENVIAANLTTAFAVVRSAGKHMSDKGGSVVLVSSAAALIGIASNEAVAAAKAGIIGLVHSAGASYAASHLRFNAVAPGLVETPLTAELTTHAAAREASLAMHALKRLGNPEEIASAILFFLSSENSWITGQVMAVDGGLSTVLPKVKL